MRCKKHITDYSSSVGVCASCLRERLFSLIAAQSQAQVQARLHHHHHHQPQQNLHPQPTPLPFPRSVSPYTSLHQSNSSTWQHHHRSFPDQRFYSTPQLGPTGTTLVLGNSIKKKNNKFSFFSDLFRTEPKKSDPGDASDPTRASTSSQSWLSTLFTGRRKKQSRTFSLDETTLNTNQRGRRNRDRGMSPARDEEDQCCDMSSGYSSESSSRDWKQTPVRSTAVYGSSTRGGGVRKGNNRNVSGMTFCLSPLVRASPNRQWSCQKGGVTAEMVVVSRDVKVKQPRHNGNATSFCKNKSRKLADFGREVRT